MATKKKMLQAAAGNAGGAGEVLNVEDVFSTYLYEGNGSTQTITNGIDLDGEGGLVWIKGRPTSLTGHVLTDTVRGATKQLQSHTTSAEEIASNGLTAFASDGFSIGSDANYSRNGDGFASWTFRKAPKFFDVVTYTGTGSAQNISHDLDADVGFMVVKRLDSASTWRCWHRGLPSGNDVIHLNETGPYETNSDIWNGTAPTSTQFSVATNSNVNASGGSYVAYLFAHNDGDGEFGPDGDADIIKCGSYTGASSGSEPFIDLGFEPQFVITKKTNGTSDWAINDVMRGMSLTGFQPINPNLSNAEETKTYPTIVPQPTGFTPLWGNNQSNDGSSTYIYIAIRRGPMGIPESASEVFAPVATTATSNTTTGYDVTAGFPVDLSIFQFRNAGFGSSVADRLRGIGNTAGSTPMLYTYSTSSESASSDQFSADNMTGIKNYGYGTQYNLVNWMWKRAPKFFDVVAYTGDGVNERVINHNLGVVPEMLIVKSRTSTNEWFVYHKDLSSGKVLQLESTAAETNGDFRFPFTETGFGVSGGANNNGSGNNYIAYLFASLDGVSKVGSYTGNGTSQTIDCGFTSGARFVMVKAASTSGAWFVWDTARGIVSGTEPYLRLNSSLAEENGYDAIDPDSSGFTLNNVGTGTNDSGTTYIFYAIA